MKCKQCSKPLTADLRCVSCDLIATHYNISTSEVYSMIPINEYLAGLDEMQSQLEDAFDHQYFDTGW